MLRFIGMHTGEEIDKVARRMAADYQYEDAGIRIRYAVMSWKPNKDYQRKGVLYLPIEGAIDFLVDARGQSWTRSRLNVTCSLHNNWPPLIKDVLSMAADGRAGEAKAFLRKRLTAK